MMTYEQWVAVISSGLGLGIVLRWVCQGIGACVALFWHLVRSII